MTDLEKDILKIIWFAEDRLTSREIYNIYYRTEESVLNGDIASAVWKLKDRGLIKVCTDLKLEPITQL